MNKLSHLTVVASCMLTAPILHAVGQDGPQATEIFSRYQGNWTLITHRADSPDAPRSVLKITNACSAAGTFYVCEQRAGASTPIATIFAPTSSAGVFRSTILGTDGGLQQSGTVRVSGSRWEFPWEGLDAAGQRQFFRVINTWVDDGHVEFRKEVSADGRVWRLLDVGDEWKADAHVTTSSRN
jgi:hypothetical protein